MHLHTFSELIEGEPHARRCHDCGERQVYNPPTGKGIELTDVLVDKADLRDLIAYYRGQCAMQDDGGDALCDRLELLLDTEPQKE